MSKISIAIPCYEMSGRGVECLEYSFNKILSQTFTDFEVVVSDHSINNEIFLLCDLWSEKLNIKYIRNEKNRGSLGANLNSCVYNASGDIIKFLMQDDFLLGENSLQLTVDAFDNNLSSTEEEIRYWLVSQYYHTEDRKKLFRLHTPSISLNPLFINLIGTPSCLAVRREYALDWDFNLRWYVDGDMYFRMLRNFGKPLFLNHPTVTQLLWSGQTTNKIITSEIVNNEAKYLRQKYGDVV